MEYEKFSFSELFLKFSNHYYNNYNLTANEHPFFFFEHYLKFRFNPHDFFSSIDAAKFFITVKEKESDAFLQFELEASLLLKNNLDIYFNSCLEILIDLKTKYSSEHVTYFAWNSILLNSITNLIIQISNQNKQLLNKQNRDYLVHFLELKEPLKSFSFSKHIPDKLFNSLFNAYIRGIFVNWKEKPENFRKVFKNQTLNQRINWEDHKNSLCYLIRLLNKRKLIISGNHSHWDIVREFFLLDGETLHNVKLTSQPPPARDKRLKIENFVNSL